MKRLKELGSLKMDSSKQCRICGIEKPLNDFPKNAKGKFGVHSCCKICKNAYSAQHYAENKERKQALNKIWKKQNKDAYNAWVIQYREKTKCIRSQKNSEWYWLNKEKVKKSQKEYYENNKPKAYAKAALRRERIKRQAALCKGEIKKQIIKIYELAQKKTSETGVLHHVDHIMPLAGKNFSGLHVPWNLQIIPAHENLSKSNKLIYIDAVQSWSNGNAVPQ